MYAVRPVVLSTDDISPHQNAVYHVRPVRLNERVITEKRADLVDSVLAAKQEELVHGLLQLLARIRLYSATRGILIPHLNSDLPTGESFETVKNECSRQ